MIAMYLFSAAAFYGFMVKSAASVEESEATHPQQMLTVMPGGKAFQVVDGGVSGEDLGEQAA